MEGLIFRILRYVEMHSYLKVTLDSNLRWNNHLHEISSKATETLNLIKRNFWFCKQDTKSTLYNTLLIFIIDLSDQNLNMLQLFGTRIISVT